MQKMIYFMVGLIIGFCCMLLITRIFSQTYTLSLRVLGDISKEKQEELFQKLPKANIHL